MKSVLSSASAVFDRAPSTLRGIAFMLVSALAGTLMGASVRHLSAELHPFEIAFFRLFFAFLVVLIPTLARHGLQPFKTTRLGLHAQRAVFNLIAMFAIFYALSLTPLAMVAALNFTSPLFATLVAAIVIGEVIRIRRILALAFGFVGALVIIRPGVIEFNLGTMLVLLSALAFAVALNIIKVLSRTESSVTTTLYVGVMGTPIAFLAALGVWQTPTWTQLAWLLAIGGFGSMTHLCVAQALKEADVAVVTPLSFTRLIWAALIGYLAFAEVPDVWTWVGGVMIFAAVFYITYRERGTASEPGNAQAG